MHQLPATDLSGNFWHCIEIWRDASIAIENEGAVALNASLSFINPLLQNANSQHSVRSHLLDANIKTFNLLPSSDSVGTKRPWGTQLCSE